MSDNFDLLFPGVNAISTKGAMRSIADDFQVVEIIKTDFSGDGEHLWLFVQKINSNTDWVAKQLARACGVSPRQVGYAGLKDRHALTSQWFSVQLPVVDDRQAIQEQLPPEVLILKNHRHHKKLRTGGLKGNQFKLTIRNIEGDRPQLEQNVINIKTHGVPNYFGAQRFGHGMGNVQSAADWFAGQFRPKSRNLKSLLISTARSWIFNQILATRIRQGNWLTPLPGDIFQLDGSHSWFRDDQTEKSAVELQRRLEEQDVHITAALWGDDELQSSGLAAELERRVGLQYPELLAGMHKHRLQHARRAIRLPVRQLTHQWSGDDLSLSFELSAGGYATCVVRELLAHQDLSLKE